MLGKDADKTESERFQQENDEANLDRRDEAEQDPRFAETPAEEIEQPADEAGEKDEGMKFELDMSNPEPEPAEKSGIEHTWETNLSEGGVLDQLTEQIGQGIVEKFGGSENYDREQANAIVDKYSPESRQDNDMTQEKEQEADKDEEKGDR